MQECVRYYGIEINRSGFVRCPFHGGDRTPSLKIYPGNRGWCCFGCNTSGSVIDFVMHYFNLDFTAATIKLNDDFNLGLPVGKVKALSYRDRKSFVEKSREIVVARKKVNQTIEEAERTYNDALDMFCACDLILLLTEPMSDDWCKALHYISTAKYRLDEAEMGVLAAREQQCNFNSRLDGK